MPAEIVFPLYQVVSDTFAKGVKTDLDNSYLKEVKHVTKWMLYSDYCLDDKNKPNDLVSFTLVPYVDNIVQLSEHIKRLANVDIKNTKKVRKEFVDFLKIYPLVNFSFIINNRKVLLGSNHILLIEFLKTTFTYMRQQYIEWIPGQPDEKDHYNQVIKKLNCIIDHLGRKKKIKEIATMVLVTFLGAFVSSRIVKVEEVEIFGWFSDRDAINDVCNGSSVNLFHYYLHGLSGGKEFKFAAAPAGSADNPFYEELVRIPDYVAGALADYDMATNQISKDKFDTMLTDYMAENNHNNFVFKIARTDDGISCSRIVLTKKTDTSSNQTH